MATLREAGGDKCQAIAQRKEAGTILQAQQKTLFCFELTAVSLWNIFLYQRRRDQENPAAQECGKRGTRSKRLPKARFNWAIQKFLSKK